MRDIADFIFHVGKFCAGTFVVVVSLSTTVLFGIKLAELMAKGLFE